MTSLKLKGGEKMKPKWIVSLVVFVLFLIFLLQNTQVVTLKLYFWSISMSQIILVPLMLILGFIAGYIVAQITGKHAAAIKAEKREPGEVANH